MRDVEVEVPRVVVIGGGTGLSVMLRGLKKKPLDITAIVTVADDGGSSGVLRDGLNIPPPGDIRNVMSALADTEPLLSQLLQYRFKQVDGLIGHPLGNLILAALSEITGDFVGAVRELSRVLAVRGQVLPAANIPIILKAEMEDGTRITGESKIPQARGRIKRVMIEPADVEPLPEAVEALTKADVIIVGPGSLYTSIIPNLLVPAIAQAVVASPALKVFICNVMTQPGETDSYTVSDHLKAVEEHIGCNLFDYVIVNNGAIPPEVEQKYSEEGAAIVELDEEELALQGYRIIADELVYFHTYLRHDADKLSHHIYKLVENRLLRKR